MANLDYWSDLAQRAFVQSFPSQQWAHKIVEPYRGLPFGSYLQASRPRRLRALTAPIDPSRQMLWQRFQVFGEPEQQTFDQTQSLFFSKLPLDVRNLVYEELLGDKIFHISAQNHNSRILLWICTRPDSINEQPHECHDLDHNRAVTDPASQSRSLLPILLACRKTYSEAVEILYKLNTFEFRQSSTTFRLLKFMVPAQRLQNIRHFRLHMRIPHHPALNARSRRDWSEFFDFFAQDMTGLTTFYLRLQLLQPIEAQIKETDDREGSLWIRPMMQMALILDQRRSCSFQFVTAAVLHDCLRAYRDARLAYLNMDERHCFQTACEEVHRSVRRSLDNMG